MKVLMNRVGQHQGGINRRIHEMAQYVASIGEHELVVVGMGEGKRIEKEDLGRVRQYWLTRNFWQRVMPGAEGPRMHKYMVGIDSFEQMVSVTCAELVDIIAREKPNICFVQANFYFPWCLMAAAKTTGVPIVHLYSGSSQTEVLDVGLRQQYLTLERHYAAYADKTIFNSRLGRRTAQYILDQDFSKAPMIYSGFPRACAALRGRLPDDIVVGWVGRNAAVKNIVYLLQLRRYLPRADAQIQCVIGTASEPTLCNRLASEDISVIEPMGPSQMTTFYEGISCMLCTSHFEFFSNASAEGLAAGRTPIVPANSGLAEILRANDLGDLVVDLRDVSAVAEMIRNSRRFSDAVMALSERLTRTHSWSDAIAQYFAEFDKSFTAWHVKKALAAEHHKSAKGSLECPC